MIEYLFQLDCSVLLWIQRTFISTTITPIMTFITHMGNAGAIWIILSCILCINKKTRRVGILSLIALVASFLIDNIILKNLVARIRPYELVSKVQCLIEKQNDYSFPSGHTGSAFAAAMVMFFKLPKKYSIWCVIFAFIIGFSRLYLGVHYPSDVIMGAVIGTIIAIIVVKLERFIEMRERVV